MKKTLFINVLLCAAATLSGQTVWNQLPLTGAGAKIIAATRQPRFRLSLTGTVLPGSMTPGNLELVALQNAVFSPGTAEQLLETFGGAFFIGNPSGQHGQFVKLNGRTQVMFGLRLGMRLGQRFEIQAFAQHFQSKWSGEFPVAVFPHDQQSKPKTLQGTANTAASGMLLDLETVFFVSGRGVVRPYLKAGLRGQFPMEHESGAEIAGIALPLEIKPLETEFSLLGGAGLQVILLKNGFIETGVVFGKWPGDTHKPALETGAGWRF